MTTAMPKTEPMSGEPTGTETRPLRIDIPQADLLVDDVRRFFRQASRNSDR
jgi:hypothetical protein